MTTRLLTTRLLTNRPAARPRRTWSRLRCRAAARDPLPNARAPMASGSVRRPATGPASPRVGRLPGASRSPEPNAAAARSLPGNPARSDADGRAPARQPAGAQPAGPAPLRTAPQRPGCPSRRKNSRSDRLHGPRRRSDQKRCHTHPRPHTQRSSHRSPHQRCRWAMNRLRKPRSVAWTPVPRRSACGTTRPGRG